MGTSILSPRTRHGSTVRVAGLFIAALVLAALLLGAVFTPGAKAAVSYSAEEIAFVKLINDYRAANGLGRLLVSDRLSEAGDRHSSDMGKYKFFSHYSLQSDWFPYNASPWDRMAKSGYDFYTNKGENIAAGQSTAAQVFGAWKGSPGHNANMLGSSFKVIGVSLVTIPGSPYTYYWTTDFGGYEDSTAHTVDGQAPAPSGTVYQQTDSRLLYSGSWSTSSTSSASGGSFRYVNKSGASVTLTFDGTSLAWIAKKSSVYGKAKVTVDGGAPVTVDLYSSTVKWKQKVWQTGTLKAGVHTVKIEWTGTKCSSATATNINADAFEIVGALVQTQAVKEATTPSATRYQQTDSRLGFAGTWATFSTSGASGGSYKRANTNSASVTVKFTGTYLAWIATKGTTLGKAFVSLDGGPAISVDLSRSSVAYQQKVWNTGTLAEGTHTVKIWRDPSSDTGKYISLDAFDIIGAVNQVTVTAAESGTTPTRYQQTDSRLAFAGTWYTFSVSGASGGSYKRASTNSASVTVKFTGTYLAWIATKGTTLGKAFVSLDGGPAISVDLARSSVAYQQKVWNTGTLAEGTHTVKIWRDPSSDTGKYISVDAFDIIGKLN